MMRYRKVPMSVEAIQVTPQNLWSISKLSPDVEVVNWRTQMPTFVRINTLNGITFANPGDWVVKGLAGEFYPCESKVFAATYVGEPG